MNTQMNSEDIIFNFFKQICDEKNDDKCIALGKSWIKAMLTNLTKMEKNLEESDKIKYQIDIEKNKQHLTNLQDKTSTEWREYATLCMTEIIENKSKRG